MNRLQVLVVRGALAAALALFGLTASVGHAYPTYDNGGGVGCVECHNQFQGGNGALHLRHREDFGISECNLCHPSGGGSVPVYTFWSGPNGGFGCAGCHGRDYGEASVTAPHAGQPKATAYGLRLFHVNKGYTQCGTSGCHKPGLLGESDPFPPVKGENVPPPYYGTGLSTLVDPCSSAQEDNFFDADTVGLDNDGDGLVDYPADPDCPVPTTTTTSTSTTTTTLPFDCAPAPLPGCVPPGKGVFVVNEKVPGKEKVKLALKKLETATGPSDFGNPVSGTTKYNICVYDAANQLQGQFTIARAGETCGIKPCFTLVTGKGYKFSDKSAASDGVLKMVLLGGDAGLGKAKVVAKNLSATLPLGLAAAFASQTSATVQVVTSDAGCIGVSLAQVRVADGLIFSAVGP